jgi:hypothetical protein
MTQRNYRKEYDNYHSKPEQREKNAARLRARRLMVKKGKVKKNDKMDVHHKDNDPTNNDTSNLSVTTQKYNRTEPRLRKEDVPMNSTGPNVRGTGTDVATWKKNKKKKKVKSKYKDKKDTTWESAQESVDTVEVPTPTPDTTFASMPVFKVPDSEFSKCKFGKNKFARWARHMDTDSETGKKIYAYAKQNPKKSIIVQHQDNGHMLYLRKYSKTDGTKSGIMVRKGDKK